MGLLAGSPIWNSPRHVRGYAARAASSGSNELVTTYSADYAYGLASRRPPAPPVNPERTRQFLVGLTYKPGSGWSRHYPHGTQRAVWTEWRAGFPFRSVACSRFSDSTGNDTYTDAWTVRLSATQGTWILANRALWTGFFLNVACYAVITQLLLFTPGLLLKLRQRARKTAGRCGFCGYDRRGLAPQCQCPECGKGEVRV
jgi:hypothetical protein